MIFEIKELRNKLFTLLTIGAVLALLIIALRVPLGHDSVNVKIKSESPTIPSTTTPKQEKSSLDKCLENIYSTGDFRASKCEGIDEDDSRLPLDLKRDGVVVLSPDRAKTIRDLCQNVYALSEENSDALVLEAYALCDDLDLMP